jgi:hypothetical protein
MEETPRSSLPVSPNLPQPREVVAPDFTSNVYIPIFMSITGAISTLANRGPIWVPIQSRFILRGGYFLCYVDVAALAGTAGSVNVLELYDESIAILPLGLYGGTAPVGDIITGTFPYANAAANVRQTALPWGFDLGKGYRSVTLENRLMVGGNRDIGAGKIIVTGMVWGVQE